MRRYAVETIVDENVKYYFIRDCETLEIVLLPSKYLKHKTKSNRSPQYSEAVRILHLLLPGILLEELSLVISARSADWTLRNRVTTLWGSSTG